MNLEEYGKMCNLEDKHWWFVSKRNVLYNLVNDSVNKKEKTNQKILEIGCGTGGNSNLFSGNYVAADISKDAVRFFNNTRKKKIVIADANTLPFKKGLFDYVLAFDVLEHIADESIVLKKIYTLLNDEGVFVINVPAFMMLWGANDVLNHHVRRYRMNQITNLLEKNGFVILKKRYWNMFLFPVVFFVRKILRKNESDLKKITSWKNKLLIYLLNFETLLSKYIYLPFGVSIALVVKKK